MHFIYSKHLRVKIRIRKFKLEDPLKVVRHPERKFVEAVNTNVCVKTIKYGKRRCKVAVFYTSMGANAIIKTIHPTNDKQIMSKLLTGKWVEII